MKCTELFEKIQQNIPIVIVDVREPHEWQQGIIANSLCYSLSTLAAHANELSHANEIVFVCRAGVRSVTACEIMEELIDNIPLHSLQGGIVKWQHHNYPLLVV